MSQGKIIIISGPSGSGKTVITKAVEEQLPNDAIITTCTTREPRDYEENHKHYHFLTKEEFEEKQERGYFLEYAKVHGHLYGTPLKEVEEALEAGKLVYLTIDVQGALQVKEKKPETILIFIKPEDNENLKKRVMKRQDISEEEWNTRMISMEKELQLAERYDYTVINKEGELEKAIAETIAIIKKEL